jgi:hypothetical protein
MGGEFAVLIAMIQDPVRAVVGGALGAVFPRWLTVVWAGAVTAVIGEMLLHMMQVTRNLDPATLLIGWVAAAIWVAAGVWLRKWLQSRKEA